MTKLSTQVGRVRYPVGKILQTKYGERAADPNLYGLPNHLEKFLDEPFSPQLSLQIDKWHTRLALEGLE